MSGSDLRDLVLTIILIADTLVFGLMLWRWLSGMPAMAAPAVRSGMLNTTVAARQVFGRRLAHG